MKDWLLKVNSTPQDIIKKLDAAFGSGNAFVYKKDHDKNDSLIFNIRKRILYLHQFLHRNRIIVNGTILNSVSENETDVAISFKQNYLITSHIFILFGLGLFTLILGINSSSPMIILGGILLVTGIILWIASKKKLENDTQKFKSLISEILVF